MSRVYGPPQTTVVTTAQLSSPIPAYTAGLADYSLNVDAPGAGGVTVISGFVDIIPPSTTVTVQSVTKVSAVSGFTTTNITWVADEDCQQFQFREVTSASDPVTAGRLVQVIGSVAANTPATTPISSSMLSAGDGPKLIKIFAQDLAGNWTL